MRNLGGDTYMTEELFRVYSVIGILLTFLSSLAAVIVSTVTIRATRKMTKQTNYQNTISASRAKWQSDLREAASKYFTQIARLCGGQENNMTEIYNELTLCHFTIVLLIFKQDESLHNEMSIIRDKARKIIDYFGLINNQYHQVHRSPEVLVPEVENIDTVIVARRKIFELRNSIVEEHQYKVFDEIHVLIEAEWKKQQYEATEMWEQAKK